MTKSSIAERYLRTSENNHLENAPKSPPKSLKSPVKDVSPTKSESSRPDRSSGSPIKHSPSRPVGSTLPSPSKANNSSTSASDKMAHSSIKDSSKTESPLKPTGTPNSLVSKYTAALNNSDNSTLSPSRASPSRTPLPSPTKSSTAVSPLRTARETNNTNFTRQSTASSPTKPLSPLKSSDVAPQMKVAESSSSKNASASITSTPNSPGKSSVTRLGPRPDRNPSMHNQDLSPSEVSWDRERKNWQTYEYSCHVTEAKEWMEKILKEELPPVERFPESLQNGVASAKLVQISRPDLMKWPIFQHKRLQYRHTENITQFFDLLDELRVPQLFLFDMTDLYEKRNLPKVIYCIHAISHFIADIESQVSAVDNLVGKLEFSEDQINTTEKGLVGHSMPNFGAMTRHLSGKQEKLEIPPEEPAEEIEDVVKEAPAVGEEPVNDQPEVEDEEDDVRAEDKEEEAEEEEEEDDDYEREYMRKKRSYRSQPKPRKYDDEYYEYDDREISVKPRRFRDYYDDSYDGEMTDLTPPRSRRQRPRNYSFGSGSEDDSFEPIRIRPQRRYKNNDRDYYSDRIDSFTASTRAVSRDMYHRRYSQHDGRHMRGYDYRNLSSTASLRSRVLTSAERMLMELEELEPEIVLLEAVCRGVLLRRSLKENKKNAAAEQWVTNLQAHIRGNQLRASVTERKNITEAQSESSKKFQGVARAKLIRSKFNAAANGADNLVHFQSLARGVLMRRRLCNSKEELGSKESLKSIVQLQSSFRGIMTRFKLGCLYDDLDQHLHSMVIFQGQARGASLRRSQGDYRSVWENNVDKIVLIQSFWRAKAQGSKYRTLVFGTKPTSETIRPFLRLIDDKPEDFKMELELENILKDINKQVKANEKLETVIEQLDMKIALLVKNNISIDESLSQQQRQNEKSRMELKKDSNLDQTSDHLSKRHSAEGSKADVTSGLKEQFDPKTLQKPSRDRVESYQGLLYVLQTQPSYISKLMTLKPPKSLDIVESILAVFGCGESPREMFFLSRQLGRSITQSTVGSSENTVAWCIVSQLNRRKSSNDIARKILAPATRKLKAMSDLLLEYDPHLIYEHLTGGGDLSAETAIQDPAVQAVFVQNLHRSREITMIIIQSVAQHIGDLPYHVRFIAREVHREVLRVTSDHKEASAAVGQVVISQYLQPASINADSLDLLDGAVGNNAKNLTSVGRVLHQIGLMTPFTVAGGTDVYLQPLNDFVKSRAHQLSQSFQAAIIEAPDLQIHFGLSELDDITMHERPILNIAMDDIFSLHYMCYNNENVSVTEEDVVLKPIIDQLGPLPRDAREMLDLARFKNIKLELNPKYGANALDDSKSGVSSLLATAKRCLGYVSRVQGNEPSVMSSLVAPVESEDEHRYNLLSDTDNTREAAGDLAELTFRDLKALTLEIVLELESAGHVSREDDYQVLINAIAEEIRNKDKVRQRRQTDLDSKKRTLASVKEKGEYLQNRVDVYGKHINEAMVTLQSEAAQHLNAARAKRKFPLSVPKQSSLDMNNPRFGSYRVSADKSYEKGILIRLRGYTDRERKDIYFTFSSHEVAQFQMDVTSKNVLSPNGSIKLTLDELLSKQYQNEMHIDFMTSNIQFSTNRSLHLILTKFLGTSA